MAIYVRTHFSSFSFALLVSFTFNHIHICSGSSLALISSRGFIDIRTLTHYRSALSYANCAFWCFVNRFRIDNEKHFSLVTPKTVSSSTQQIVCPCLCFAFLTLQRVFVYVFGWKRLCAHESDPSYCNHAHFTLQISKLDESMIHFVVVARFQGFI